MKATLKILAAVVVMYGGLYLLTGTTQLYVIVKYDRGLPGPIVINFVIALTSLLIGAGLFLAKSWARRAWLIASVVFLLFHVLWLWLLYLNHFYLASQVWNVIQTSVLALLSWVYLTRPAVKQRFHKIATPAS
jgi:hypothetical protein